ncbi:MAG: O-methyltransferase family 3 [Solirubrobacterales bacterium]|nr:O-methyltransferase family 3 [Solirubrobacterales bacterium]
MPSTLRSPAVASVLRRLHAAAQTEDEPAKQQVCAREAELGLRLSQVQRYAIYGEAPLAIQREVGELLYLVTLSRRPRTVVEFGASLGVSTIYLAAALQDSGGGLLVTTELLASKAESARRNLIDAGLDSLVELRVGDALDTLRRLDGTVDVLFLDGRNDLYLDVLHVVEPCMTCAALVVADLNVADPDLLPYLTHVRDPTNGYRSVEVPLADGVELSVKTPR